MDLGEGTTVYGGARAARRALRKEEIAKSKRRAYRMRDLLFADDIALVAESRAKLEKALQNLTDVFATYGLTVSISKTKWQALAPLADNYLEEVKINGAIIERKAEFVYLGSVFNQLGTVESDIRNRIKLANVAMRRIRKIIWHKGTPIGLKRKILMTFIYPTLTYGCDTWPLTKTGKGFQALKTFWHKQLRKCCGVTKRDRWRMEDIFKRTGAQRIEDLVRERRLRYLGHVMRYPQTRLTKQMVGAVADADSEAKGLGWTRVMASELAHYRIKVKHLFDKDKYREKLNSIFRKPRKGAGETDSESNSQ